MCRPAGGGRGGRRGVPHNPTQPHRTTHNHTRTGTNRHEQARTRAHESESTRQHESTRAHAHEHVPHWPQIGQKSALFALCLHFFATFLLPHSCFFCHSLVSFATLLCLLPHPFLTQLFFFFWHTLFLAHFFFWRHTLFLGEAHPLFFFFFCNTPFFFWQHPLFFGNTFFGRGNTLLFFFGNTFFFVAPAFFFAPPAFFFWQHPFLFGNTFSLANPFFFLAQLFFFFHHTFFVGTPPPFGTPLPSAPALPRRLGSLGLRDPARGRGERRGECSVPAPRQCHLYIGLSAGLSAEGPKVGGLGKGRLHPSTVAHHGTAPPSTKWWGAACHDVMFVALRLIALPKFPPVARVASVHPNCNLLGFSAALAPKFHPLQIVNAPKIFFSVSVKCGYTTHCSAPRWLRHPSPIHTRLLGKPVRRALILAASDSGRRPPAVMADAMQWPLSHPEKRSILAPIFLFFFIFLFFWRERGNQTLFFWSAGTFLLCRLWGCPRFSVQHRGPRPVTFKRKTWFNPKVGV